MDIYKRAARLLLTGAFLVGVASTQSISFSYRQAGNLVGAVAGGTGTNSSWGVNLNPVIGADGRDSYLVSWTVQTWTDTQPTPSNPYPRGAWVATVIGIAPASEVRGSPSGALTIDLSTSKLSQVQFAMVADCTTQVNPCAPGNPMLFAVRGAFTPCQAGVSCATFSRSGTNEQRAVYLPWNVITTVFTGNETGGDADFTGTVGPLVIPANSANFRNLTIRKGLLRYEQTPLN